MLRPIALRPLAVLAAALLLATPQLADAQWKWKDKAGRVQYSDLPPPSGTPDSDILSKPSTRTTEAPRMTTAPLSAASAASASASAAPAPRTQDPELEAKRKKLEADQAAKLKADQDRYAAAKAENCRRDRENLRALDSGVRVGRVNDKNEREFLDDKQRLDEAQRVKGRIAADCK